MRSKAPFMTGFALTAALFIIGGFLPVVTAHLAVTGAYAETPLRGLGGDQNAAVPTLQSEVKLTFAPVVKRSAPSVVNVYATRMVRERVSPFAGDPFFEQFFSNRDFGRSRPRESSSLGSGVIVDPSGIVVTNFHVIADATDIRIALSDRREFEAEVILKDQNSDLAVLKLVSDGASFPALSFARQDSLEVGDLVLAIGNPFGVGQTVTQGIVSALARTQAGISDSSFFIQTDAAINPGNSGGALIDVNGDIVGINTAIFSKSGGSIGIGFAIPSDMVQTVVNSALRGSTRVEHPWIGAEFQNVDADSALALGLENPSGILITSLYDKSPAAQSGLAVGDLIVAVNEAGFDDVNGFNYRVATLGVGKKAALSVVRAGRKKTIEVDLVPPPETVPRDVRLLDGQQPFSGATIANLSPALADELRFRGPTRGVVITEITPRSFAARFGLRPGDIILRLNGRTVETTRQLEEMVSARQPSWQFAVNRGGKVLQSDKIRG